MSYRKIFLLVLLVTIVTISTWFSFISPYFYSNKELINDLQELTKLIDVVTVRVNTFRRLDLLETFLAHYHQCDVVRQVQIIWSDPDNPAPLEWSKHYMNDKVVFEVHHTDSLNHRFHNILPIPTEAVLSIDDDLVVPCDVIDRTVRTWRSNKRVLVGFSPRMVVWDVITGAAKYLHWQHTWWTGIYSLVLTKASILHRDYLKEYDATIPTAFMKHVDAVRNCEDIAMAHVIAAKSGAAPVWYQGVVYETSVGGISSSQSHFTRRGDCVQMLINMTDSWPWITGYQKVVPVGLMDAYRLFLDPK